MHIERKSIPFEVKAVEDPAGAGAGGAFEGIGGCFHNIDSAGDIIAPGAFAADIPKFLADGFIGGLNHNWDNPIGHPVEAKETAEGLHFKAVLDDTPDAQAIRAKMRPHPASGRATIRKLSIGYRTLESEPLKDAEAVRSYWKSAGYAPAAQDESGLKSAFTARRHPQTGKDYTPGIRLLKKLSLYEVSPVSVPANDRAVVTGAKMYGESAYRSPMGGMADPDSLLGDTDEILAAGSMARLHDLLCMTLWGILNNDMLAMADRLTLIGRAVDQFKASLLDVLAYFLADEDAEPGTPGAEAVGGAIEAMSRQFKAALGVDPGPAESRSLPGAVPAPGFDQQSRSVVSAVGVFVDRADARIEARLKDGRELSAANRAALSEVHDGLMGHAGKLREMLDRPARSEKPKALDPPPDAAPPQPQPQTNPEAKATPTRVDPAVVKALFNRHLDTKRAALSGARSEGK
jgi:HK97 family phage prohead protease